MLGYGTGTGPAGGDAMAPPLLLLIAARRIFFVVCLEDRTDCRFFFAAMTFPFAPKIRSA